MIAKTMRYTLSSLIGVVALAILFGVNLNSQSNPSYIQFSPPQVKGALYKPDSLPQSHVGVLVIHRTANFMAHIACRELSRRGFLVLCMNPRSDNNEAAVRWEELPLDVKSGVDFLRKQPGITKVLLFGHSGGGPTTTFYQAVAENGPSYCQGPKKLVQCDDRLVGLPRADGLILADSHPGISVMTMRSLNGAVINDVGILERNEPPQIAAELDPFNPRNGYNPRAASKYSEDFKRRYFAAQSQRMGRLIDIATQRIEQINQGTYRYPDDDTFVVVKGGNPTRGGAMLSQMDPSIDHATIHPQKLLKNDGTVVTQIVESVRQPDLRPADQDKSFSYGTLLLTLRSFLSANAVRATDSMEHIDWCSTNNSTPCALQQISAPLLITSMGAFWFIRDNEIHYEVAKSKDKDFIIIEGANHGFTPCVPCEKTPGQYSNSVRNMFDYIARWIDARF